MFKVAVNFLANFLIQPSCGRLKLKQKTTLASLSTNSTIKLSSTVAFATPSPMQ